MMPCKLFINYSPFFLPGVDLFDWLEKVVKWKLLIKAAHDSGNDDTFQNLHRTVSQTLYARDLSSKLQAILVEICSKSTISYTQNEDLVKAVFYVVIVVNVSPRLSRKLVLSLFQSSDVLLLPQIGRTFCFYFLFVRYSSRLCAKLNCTVVVTNRSSVSHYFFHQCFVAWQHSHPVQSASHLSRQNLCSIWVEWEKGSGWCFFSQSLK